MLRLRFVINSESRWWVEDGKLYAKFNVHFNEFIFLQLHSSFVQFFSQHTIILLRFIKLGKEEERKLFENLQEESKRTLSKIIVLDDII